MNEALRARLEQRLRDVLALVRALHCVRAMRLLVVVLVAACWHSRAPDLARWQRPAAVVDLLPAGAWLVGGMDIDTSDSKVQRDNEAKIRADPNSVRNATGGCTIPAANAAVAVYGDDDVAFVGRGVFQPAALLACMGDVSIHGGGTASHQTIEGYDVLVTKKTDTPVLYAASDSGIFLMATEPIMQRSLAADLQAATADPALAPLIARARAGGEVWAAARLARNTSTINEVLRVLGVKLDGHVTTLIAWIHFTPPFHIEVDLALEQAGDATRLAAALEQKRQLLAALDARLKPIADSLRIRADGTHVHVVGNPEHVDWLEAFQALLAAIAVIAK